MKYHILFSVIYLMVIFVNEITGRTSELLRITLPNQSKLIGKYLTSVNGYGFRGFIGIPYAEPPIGDLRFRNPVPAAPWAHERKVMDDVNVCIQWNPFARRTDIYGSEDCLYLNVYTPLKNTKPLPVMVYFHGGGFIAGSGNKIYYGPDYLLDNNDVIYISANYRLGPFGFLSTGQEDCPGNFGLKDQVLILKWIQENIRVFGGDPNQVTIFGDSAGGASVTYLMMSPLSKGLFHKGISQSGTYLDSWAEPIYGNLAQQRAIKAGKSLDCSLDNSKNWNLFVNCLRTKSAFDVINVFKHFYDWDVDPMVAFPPVVEAPGPNAFISEHPRDVTEVHGDSIPWIVGINLDEGALKSAHIMEIPELYNDVKNNWSKILPIILYYNNYPEHVKEQITSNINRFYFGDNKQYTKELNQNFTNIISDGWFVIGMDKYLRKRLEKSKPIESQTYIYLFAHKGEYSFTEAYKGDPEKFYGVCHMDELLYLFPMVQTLFPASVPSPSDNNMRKIMVELWINFVETGNPTPYYSNLPKWQPTIGYPLDYYRIGNVMDENKSLLEMEKVISIKNLKISVPEAIASGDTVTLSCEYDLESAALYSIRWYFDSEEFYRFIPKESPPRRAFNISAGLSVDLNRSDDYRVTLMNLEQKQSGTYQCEASADAPLFHTETGTSTMFVAELPQSQPTLTVKSLATPDQKHTTIGETIHATCTSLPSFPPVNFTWVVNGERHPSTQQGLRDNIQTNAELKEAWAELIFIIDNHKITKNRKLIIRCETNIYSVYRGAVESQLFILEDPSEYDGARVSPTTDQRGNANRAGDPDNSALKASALIFCCNGKYIILRLAIVWLLILLIS